MTNERINELASLNLGYDRVVRVIDFARAIEREVKAANCRAILETERQLKIANDCCDRLMSACNDAGCPDGKNMADWIKENVRGEE